VCGLGGVGEQRTGGGSQRQIRGGLQEEVRKDANGWVSTYASPLAWRCSSTTAISRGASHAMTNRVVLSLGQLSLNLVPAREYDRNLFLLVDLAAACLLGVAESFIFSASSLAFG
jgi:hypothetical protein